MHNDGGLMHFLDAKCNYDAYHSENCQGNVNSIELSFKLILNPQIVKVTK